MFTKQFLKIPTSWKSTTKLEKKNQRKENGFLKICMWYSQTNIAYLNKCYWVSYEWLVQFLPQTNHMFHCFMAYVPKWSTGRNFAMHNCDSMSRQLWEPTNGIIQHLFDVDIELVFQGHYVPQCTCCHLYLTTELSIKFYLMEML